VMGQVEHEDNIARKRWYDGHDRISPAVFQVDLRMQLRFVVYFSCGLEIFVVRFQFLWRYPPFAFSGRYVVVL